MNNKRQFGFTLLELVVVIALTGMISAVMIANFKNGERAKRVSLAADGTVNLMRLAQEYTLAGRQIPSSLNPVSGTRCVGDNSIEYYSVKFNQSSTSASLYAYDSCNAAFILETFNFPQGTRIKQNSISVTMCDPSCGTTTNSSVEVAFVPPFARITAARNGSTTFFRMEQADVTFETNDGSRTRTMRIDGISGRVGVLQIPG